MLLASASDGLSGISHLGDRPCRRSSLVASVLGLYPGLRVRQLRPPVRAENNLLCPRRSSSSLPVNYRRTPRRAIQRAFLALRRRALSLGFPKCASKRGIFCAPARTFEDRFADADISLMIAARVLIARRPKSLRPTHRSYRIHQLARR